MSIDTPACPFNRFESVPRETPKRFAASPTVHPITLTLALMDRPGCDELGMEPLILLDECTQTVQRR